MVAGLRVGQTKPPARWGSALGPWEGLWANPWVAGGLVFVAFLFRSRFVLVAVLAQPSFGSNTFWLKPPIFQGAPRGGHLAPLHGAPRGGWSVWVGLVTHVSGPPRGRCWETELMGSSVCERRHTLAYAPLSAQSPSDGGGCWEGGGGQTSWVGRRSVWFAHDHPLPPTHF